MAERLLPATTGPLPPDVVRSEFERLHEVAVEFEGSTLARNTQITYQRAWTRFEAWCQRRGATALPASPELIRLYATDLVTTGIPYADGTPAEKPGSLRTLDLHLAAIGYAHESRFPGQESPVHKVPKHFRQGVKRKLTKPPRKKEWVGAAQLAEFVTPYADTLRGKRDKAILLCAFDSGGRRRSEVTGMRVEHLRRDRRSGDWLWSIPKTKTTDELVVVIPSTGGPLCAATALADWLAASGIDEGPVFRRVFAVEGREELRCREVDGQDEGLQPRHVATLVQRAAQAAGLNPADYGGHSLRAGFLTDMSRDGHRLEDLMARSGHRSVDVALGYVRVGRMLGEDDPMRRSLREKRGSKPK